MEETLHPAEQAAKLLQNLTLDYHLAKPGDDPDVMMQHQKVQDSAGKALGVTPTVAVPGSSANGTNSNGAQNLAVDANLLYAPNGYAPPAYYYGGYDGPVGNWGGNPRYANADGMEIPPPGVYGENVSLLYHLGYGYAPQMSYCPYSPASSPIPAIRADGHLYRPPTAFQYQDPFYQHLDAQCIPSSSCVQQGNGSISMAVEQETLPVDGTNGNAANGNGVTRGPGPCYPTTLLSTHDLYGQGIVPLNIPCNGYRDPRLLSDGVRPGGSCPDTVNIFGNQQKNAATDASPAIVSQTTPDLGLVGRNIQTSPIATVAQHPLQAYGIGSIPGPINIVCQSNRVYPHRNNYRRSGLVYAATDFDTRRNSRSWIAVDKEKHTGSGNGALCNGNGNLDALNRRKRGPRIVRFWNQRKRLGAEKPVKGQNLSANENSEDANAIPNRDQYNQPQFVTEYPYAKFYIVKSYSEDDIHKSIKYGVWTSTPKGNKKLDTAYQEAKEGTGGCPIFLFFSVNASGQFCGVAEMVGPVDFNKNVDYWQQDKWSGSFLVKWHIIKDVSNSQLRHIILENNENKSVTNSRDIQEVKLAQGTEMLNIFKNCVCKTSLLDDFPFYESRQKSMQEKRTRQQKQQCHQQSPQLEQKVLFQSGSEFDQGCYEGAILKVQDENVDETVFEDKLDTKSKSCKPGNLPSIICALDCKTTEGGQGNSTQKFCLEDRGGFSRVGNDAEEEQ